MPLIAGRGRSMFALFVAAGAVLYSVAVAEGDLSPAIAALRQMTSIERNFSVIGMANSIPHLIQCRFGQPGVLIRSEPMRLVYEPSGQLGGWVATATRIMYRSTDARGNPNAVTGTYFAPDNR